MKKRKGKNFYLSTFMLILFVLWTAGVSFIDVKPIGPQGSTVGFATVNGFFHNMTGVHIVLYSITDMLSLLPILLTAGFASLGVFQWIKRKSVWKVDQNILILGGFYIVTMLVYLWFEKFVINYRPVLIDGCLEASYPSSTTMLVMCIMPTAIMRFNAHIKNLKIRRTIACVSVAFTVFMVVARLISGVHWLTDIIGGALLSAGLVMMYRAVVSLKEKE